MCLCSTNVIFSTINGTDAFWAMLCEHFHFILFYFISFYNFFIFLRFHSFIFSDKGRQGEREGEKHQWVVSHVLPEGTGPKPRHVPDGFTAPTGVARWAGNRLVGGWVPVGSASQQRAAIILFTSTPNSALHINFRKHIVKETLFKRICH